MNARPDDGDTLPGLPVPDQESSTVDPSRVEPDPDGATVATGRRWGLARRGHLWEKDREAVAEDGTRIRYTVRGRADGPWIVLCAGFMCPDNFWVGIGPRLMRRARVIVMNYRGVGASSDPRPRGWRARHLRPRDFTISKMAGDVLAVLEAEDARDVVVLGHSMGCEVALEVWRRDPDRVAALTLVTGAYASPLYTFYGSELGTYLFPFAALILPMLPRPAQWAVSKAPSLPIAMPVARLIRALGPHTPERHMRGYFEHFGDVDPMVALKIASGMHDFDAGPWLDEVDVPTLVVVGEQDRFTPPELGDEMRRRMQDVEVVEIREGTHGALIEFPEAIHDVIADFLHRRLGHPPAPPEADPDRVRRRR